MQAMIEHIDRNKLCWNCEGSVSRAASNCPYCGVYVHPEEDAVEETPKASREISPPYQPVPSQESEIPQAPYTPKESAEESTTSYKSSAITAPTIQEDWKKVVIPMVLLMAGSMLLLFGIMMFLFSHQGYLTIRWDASYWFYYLLVSVPLLFFGWKAIEKTED